MLKRKISAQLTAWKNSNHKKPLLVQGARQVGKTYSILEFGRQFYKRVLYINFEENPSYCEIFSGNLDVDTLIGQISLYIPQVPLVPSETLIFLDEIQSCPQARTALKFFSIDGRFDVIASGSLLGIRYREVSSFPVGYVDRLTLHSLDFEEFLWATGMTEQNIAYLRDYFDSLTPVPAAVHNRMMKLFRDYVAVGGMPAVVERFLESHSYAEAIRVQREIVEDYKDDIAKYAEGNDKAKARACFSSIPRQLARDYKKFSYAVVDQGNGSARKYGGSLQWLHDAGTILFCYNLERPERPFEGNVRLNSFKVYMADTGLLVSMLEDGAQRDVINGDLGIYKGALYENIIADMLAKAGKKLYYFEKDSKLEVDFMIRFEDKTTAVEVKSSGNRKSKSMDSLIQNYGVPQGLKLAASNNGKQGDAVRVIPLYMAMFL